MLNSVSTKLTRWRQVTAASVVVARRPIVMLMMKCVYGERRCDVLWRSGDNDSIILGWWESDRQAYNVWHLGHGQGRLSL